jgi:hypothetical protein
MKSEKGKWGKRRVEERSSFQYEVTRSFESEAK